MLNSSAFVVSASGLAAIVSPGIVSVNGTVILVGATSLTMVVNSTNSIYLDSSGALQSGTSGFPAGCVPLAQVVTNTSVITRITDKRPDYWITSGGGSSGPASTSTTMTFGVLGLPVTGLKVISNVNLTNMASGDTDVYTVPANKKAIPIDLLYTNPQGTGVTIVCFVEYKSSGVYTIYDQISAAGATQGTYGTLALLAPMLLVAGESFSVNTNNVGLSIWPTILEFDAAAAVSVTRFTAFASGDNTIFTAALDGTQFFSNVEGVGAGSPLKGCVWYFNHSGVSRTISMHIVPLAGSPAVANQIINGASASSNAILRKEYYGGMKTGDFLNINTDANTAGQVAWVIYQSLP